VTIAIQGQQTVFTLESLVPPSGPPINVTNLQATIYKTSDGSTVIGPTAVGIHHIATGLDTFTWSTPSGQAVGDYVIVWTATEGTSLENFTVLPSTSGQGPSSGPCEGWEAPIWSCALSPAAQAVTGTAVAAAADILYALSGRHLGSCQVTIRPCRQSCLNGSWPFINSWWQFGIWPRPLFFNGTWYNLTCGSCTGGCSCNVVSEALLPAPVIQVLQVKVDGVTLDPSAYRVDNWRRLVRLDGGQWPICNDLTQGDDAVGTWSVTLTYGEPVSPLGQMALGELATQFAKLLACDTDCMLPKPVQQLVRQGVTMTFLDPNELFANGRIGLYLTDLFISIENPSGLVSASTVYDIDDPGYRITNT
jgi:hypothetical protein